MHSEMLDFVRQPLFVEPTDEMQREDEWSGPFGFLLGGMAQPTKQELSKQYFDAANILVESIRQMKCADYSIANPVLYLYRHSLELLLKSILGSKSEHHKLDNLSDDLVTLVKHRYKQAVPKWVTDKLKEFAAIDPNSMAFRYGEDKYDGSKICSAVADETYVGVIHLQRSMCMLYEALSNASRMMEKAGARGVA
jgi:hypothetical protein